MGFVSEWALEVQERGFGTVVGALCEKHIRDEYLKSKASPADEHDPCLACGRSKGPRLSLEGVAEFVVAALREMYADPAAELPWDGREGGYQGVTVDTGDVLYDLCVDAFDAEGLDSFVGLMVRAIDLDEWTPIGWAEDTLPSDYLWRRYEEAVCTRTRFLFTTKPGGRSYDAHHQVGEFLEKISLYTTSEMDLLHRVDAGLTVYRGRLTEKPGGVRETAADLGPAPSADATANRMSAAGISLMYASEDPQTAIAEIAGHGVRPCAVIGAFKSTKDLWVLDFTRQPVLPSFFDPEQREAWSMAKFFTTFVEKVTRPIIPDGRQHVEYAPTQVLTEFFRWMSVRHVDGIALPSSQTGRKTYVFFCDARGVGEKSEDAGEDSESDRLFTFVPEETRTYRVVRTYSGEPWSSSASPFMDD